MGSDLFQVLNTWENIESYYEQDIIVIARYGYLIDKQSSIAKELIIRNKLTIIEDFSIDNISSALILKKIVNNQSNELIGIIHKDVLRYINNNPLLFEYYQKNSN